MKKLNRYFILAFISASLLIFSSYVFAINLQSAKQQGLVGETSSGYLEAVNTANAEVSALISSVNSRRKQMYQAIAKRNGTTLNAVEHLAGMKAIKMSRSGSYIKPDGSWRKK